MIKPLRQPIPYYPDSTALFEALAHLPRPLFLDGGRPYSSQSRYDILAADPTKVLTTRGDRTEIEDREGGRCCSGDDPFALVRQTLGTAVSGLGDIPFCGGAIGYFGYDLARRLERLPVLAENSEALPEMVVGIYDWALVVDHERKQSWLVGQGRDPATLERWDELVERVTAPGPTTAGRGFDRVGEIQANMSRERYGEGFHRIKRYIRDGDCYQVNFAQCFSAEVEGTPWEGYKLLRRLNPAPFGAYLDTPFAQVLCCSPERFLRVRKGEVESRPIKGTCPRARDRKEDRRLAEMLRSSAKNRAENLMIVDLLRNDLGKSCAFGSIRVPRLFEVESFTGVHHLVSTVTGRLAPENDALALLRGCFPGGSITGAPKLRAMEIIEELEPDRRSIYCGAIGYIGFDGDMDINIAIRTMVHSAGKLRFRAGGGIVADSVMEEEYQESFQKVEAMRRMLQRSGAP